MVRNSKTTNFRCRVIVNEQGSDYLTLDAVAKKQVLVKGIAISC